MEAQAAGLRSELAALQKEVRLLRDERDVARVLNEYVYVHDQAFSPAALADEELDREFEEFFTDDGVVDAFGLHTARKGKADTSTSVLTSQGDIVGMQMVTSNTVIQVSDDGLSATARTSALTTIASADQRVADYHRAAGYYTYRLRKENGAWRISYLKWHGLGSRKTPQHLMTHLSDSNIILQMVNLRPQFRALLASITLAIVLVDALPHQKPKPLKHELDPGPLAPLTRRGREGGSLKVIESRLVESGASASDGPGDHSAEAKGDHYHHHHGHNGHHPRDIDRHDKAALITDDPLIVPGDDNDIDTHSLHEHGGPEASQVVQEDVGEEVDTRFDKWRAHDHYHHRPDGISKDGHSEHWYKHHHFEPTHPYHHHHHHGHHHPRISGLRPRRFRGEGKDDGEEDTFIAPASVRAKSKNRTKSGPSGSRNEPNEMIKKPKGPTGLYRAVRPAGMDTNNTAASSGQVPQASGDQTRSLIQRSVTADHTIFGPSNGLETSAGLPTEAAGVIDLIAHANGAKLGGLSVSPVPPSAFDASFNDTSFHNATSLSYVLDATPNSTEQTIFFMRRLEDQAIPAEASGMQRLNGLLVSLQAQVVGSESTPLCSTFNPQAQYAQSIWLSPCSYSNSASANSSQVFKFSPGTGIMRPFYGDQKEISADDEADWTSHSGLNDWNSANATTVVAAGDMPLSLSPSDPFLQPVPLLNTTETSNSTCLDPACGPDSSVPQSSSPHALVIGDSEHVLQFLAGLGGNKDEGVLMVFRRVNGAQGDTTSDLGDVHRQGKRRVDSIEEPVQDRPSFFENIGSPSISDDKSSMPGHERRSVGSAVDSTSLDVERPTPARGDSQDSRITHPGIQRTPTSAASKAFSQPLSHSSPHNSTNHIAAYDDFDELNEDFNPVFDETLLPKPVINVAYFGDSGRSPPVPPEDQADSARAILVAEPGKDKRPGVGPATLATAGKLPGEVVHEDVVKVYVVGPKAKTKPSDQIVSVAGTKDKSVEEIPVDASD
ncbi:hypothetical protein FRC07_007274 [Ceratobasidium sp. 392]|nr:hypothetical protein FRC07_007274 [Ceratobasidium sp. 392]